MLKQRAQTTKAHKSSPCTLWAQTGQARSTKTGQTDFTQQTTPPKAKKAKEMHKLPLGS
jgi:hypothetical protein